MKKFKTNIYVKYRGHDEETEVKQVWHGEDIDAASELARTAYEHWFNEPFLEGSEYRVGEFVEVAEEEEEDNG